MKQYSISNLYTLTETIAFELFEGKKYPWEVLPEISKFIIKLGERLDSEKFDKVGDNISKPDGRMGCVYKEVALKQNGEWIPKIKLSNDTIKIVNPGHKKLYRAFDKDTGFAIADIMANKHEKVKLNNLLIISPQDYLKRTTIDNFILKELQVTIFKNGKLVYDDPTIEEKRVYCDNEMAKIYPEVKRTRMPHEYYVDGTQKYVEFKNNLIEETRKLVKENKNA